MTRKVVKPALSRDALEILARRFRALGDATRLALLQALFEGEHTVQAPFHPGRQPPVLSNTTAGDQDRVVHGHGGRIPEGPCLGV